MNKLDATLEKKVMLHSFLHSLHYRDSELKRHSHRVTDSGNEHRVDALEFTSIPSNLKMQVHTSKTVLHVFDNPEKKE